MLRDTTAMAIGVQIYSSLGRRSTECMQSKWKQSTSPLSTLVTKQTCSLDDLNVMSLNFAYDESMARGVHPHTHTIYEESHASETTWLQSARDYKPSQNPLTSLRSDRTSMHKLNALPASFYLFTARAIASKCASSPSFLFIVQRLRRSMWSRDARSARFLPPLFPPLAPSIIPRALQRQVHIHRNDDLLLHRPTLRLASLHAQPINCGGFIDSYLRLE